MIKSHILSSLGLNDAFANPIEQLLPLDLSGNNDAQIHHDMINKFRPQILIEVGTWKGSSAIATAKILKSLHLDAVIICVDTWLGGMSQLTKKDRTWGLDSYLRNGYPTVYEQFASNVIHEKVQDYILPIPNTSIAVSRWLKSKQIFADLIYIDGSHEYEDVYQDLKNYNSLLSPNGIMWGDDWHIHAHGVVAAVTQFAHENSLNLVFDHQYNKWFLSK